MDDKPWFRPRVLGYGAGLPVCWQGWAVVAGFVSATLLGVRLTITYLTGDLRHIALIAAVAVPLGVFGAIARKKTEGGWRWRDGSHL
ncbi:MAG: hypothetical protein KGI68_11220 [Alphaproteobacteria bacterium]|nr:hypothetical protein [Alphaproteobacteria bacterium]MDE1987233.1 hypothetical protein [Alphaproteobacteria bacterium]MDE2163170.1 hypothetical protein [Alphaproteobacteria bacterium]MDE2500985.1 hypothetical protein [Alphaproteobacteria bacterium]